MFILRINEIKEGLFTDHQDMVNVFNALCVEIQKRRFLIGYHKGVSTVLNS